MKSLIIIFLSIVYHFADAQQVMAVHIDGEAYVLKGDQVNASYDKLVLGELPANATILVKENSTVRLISGESSYIDLQGEASHIVSDLEFVAADSKSMFAKFCKYFSDFFAGHNSAEAKSSYRNRIYAVSRGKASAPSLDFPLEGSLPYVNQSMTFSWTHGCQDCRYVFQIVDYATRSSVFAETTSSQSVTLDTVKEYLRPDTRYYWTVAISGEELDYQKVIFDTSKEGDYSAAVGQISAELSQLEQAVSSSSETVYVMQNLYEQDLANYAIYYGQQKLDDADDKDQLRYLVEQAWYSYIADSY